MEFTISDLFDYALGGFSGISADIWTVMTGVIGLLLIIVGFEKIKDALTGENNGAEESDDDYTMAKSYKSKRDQFSRGTMAYDYYNKKYKSHLGRWR